MKILTSNCLRPQTCQSPLSKIVLSWTCWGPREACSVTCGEGVSTVRHRTCTNPTPSMFGHYCIGDSVDCDVCHEQTYNKIMMTTTSSYHYSCNDAISQCAVANMTIGICTQQDQARKMCARFCGFCSTVDGGWSAWSAWSQCSTSCDHGTWTRTRLCNNPSPVNGGNFCVGHDTDSGACNLRSCPVHGGWSEWAHWATCSSSCGQGMTKRLRSCTNPRPSLSGNYCFGDSSEYALCIVRQCSVDGGWTEWSFWSGCSSSCGSGQATRQRWCVNPKPARGGLNCAGSSVEHRPCQALPCSERQIGFSVSGHTVLSSLVLVFDSVKTNYGGGYSASTGKFTCYYPGLYFFSLSLIKERNDHAHADEATCYIFKNSIELSYAYNDPADDYTDYGAYESSAFAVVHLNRGDIVYVGRCTQTGTINHYSSFSGFLLKSDSLY